MAGGWLVFAPGAGIGVEQENVLKLIMFELSRLMGPAARATNHR
jgi:hypothetical protein